jgi:hypothetical protein
MFLKVIDRPSFKETEPAKVQTCFEDKIPSHSEIPMEVAIDRCVEKLFSAT